MGTASIVTANDGNSSGSCNSKKKKRPCQRIIVSSNTFLSILSRRGHKKKITVTATSVIFGATECVALHVTAA